MIRSMTARSRAGHADSRSTAAEDVAAATHVSDNVDLANAVQLADAAEDGFTLVEVLVAFTMFVIISFASLTALYTIVKSTAITQNRVAAANLARQEIERLREQNSTASQLDGTTPITSTTAQGTTYTITPTMNPAATATCSPGTERQVSVVVSWQNSGLRNVRYDTVLSC